MNESLIPTANPFDLATLDEETELAALANALRLADGFRLLFARCNQPSQRVRLMAKLEAHFPADAVAEIRLTEPIPHLLDALRERLDARKPRVVFVSGLEYSLPVAAEAENTSFVANLNSARNSFASAISCPLVLWLSEYVLTAIVRGAPDFFSIRSGTYFFAATPRETVPLFNTIVAVESWQSESFTRLEKQERIATIENLLQDYQALAPPQRDYQAEAHLLGRLGRLYSTFGRWEMADKAYEEARVIFRQREDRHGEANTLNDLGVLYNRQGRRQEAELAYIQSLETYRDIGDGRCEGKILGNLGNLYSLQCRWSEAEQAQYQALKIFRDLGDTQCEEQVLGNLGNIYLAQGLWAEAEQTYQKSLIQKRALADRHGEGHTLNNLGNVYKALGRLTDAEQVYQQSLEIKREVGDKQGEGTTLGNLGSVYLNLGRVAEADQAYRQSLEIGRHLGDRLTEGHMLGNLALVKEAEGDIANAICLGLNAIRVLRDTEDTTLVRKIQAWVEGWERFGQDASQVAGPDADA